MTRRIHLAVAAMFACLSAYALAQDRSVLPMPTPPFSGTITRDGASSVPMPLRSVRAPAGAPNVFIFMSDDTGFSMASAFGGPVPTPNFERIALAGQRYNRFHTTSMCSPSRAALLTGRNHHNAGVGYLADLPMGYPGYGGRILPETATIAQTLRLNGYNTAMFGKHHNTPGNERSDAGPFDSWPTGLGFEYFFGFIAGDSDQFAPGLFRGTNRVDPAEAGTGRDQRMLDRRLADDIIRWVHNQQASAPDKPFLIYYTPGSTHAPHQAPPSYIARFRGQFDAGWDVVREQTLARQIAMGIVPPGTILSPRPDEISAWATLSREKRAYAARAMEVAAAQLAYLDEQFGRVIDELQRTGEYDRTIFAITLGDNGASGEGGPNGALNELRAMGADDENEHFVQGRLAQMGGPMTYQNFAAGWALAMNTPLRWTKQYGSMLGGIRNGMMLAWPGHVAQPGAICPQFGHLIDIVPTVLEAANIPAPRIVNGVEQRPMDGQSLLPSLSHCDPDHPRTQYFEMAGKVGLYKDGWFLSGDDGRLPWQLAPSNGLNPPITWTLYDLSHDFSQTNDLSAQEPARLSAMMASWEREATRNNVFPLFHSATRGRVTPAMMAGSGRTHFDFWGKDISLPTSAEPRLFGRSFTLNADLILSRANASGAVMALGSRFGGWSLYLDRGRPTFTWARSTDPAETMTVQSTQRLSAGATTLRLRFVVTGRAGPATVIISSGDQELVRGQLPSSVLMPSGNTETLDAGRDIGAPVVDYLTPFGAIEGDIQHIGIDLE